MKPAIDGKIRKVERATTGKKAQYILQHLVFQTNILLPFAFKLEVESTCNSLTFSLYKGVAEPLGTVGICPNQFWSIIVHLLLFVWDFLIIK